MAAPTAAIGRQQIVNKLQSVQAALELRRDEIDEYLTWVARQEANLPATPAITQQTSWRYDIRFIERVVAFINYRTDLLRHRGCNLDDTWTLDTGTLIAGALQPPRGTETGQLIFRDAVVDAEVTLRSILHELHEVERTHVWSWVNTLLNAARECLKREKAAPFVEWLQNLHELKQLREAMDFELNADAVWLHDQRAKLTELKTKVGDDTDWRVASAEHEKIVLEVLEEAEALGIQNAGMVGALKKMIYPAPA